MQSWVPWPSLPKGPPGRSGPRGPSTRQGVWESGTEQGEKTRTHERAAPRRLLGRTAASRRGPADATLGYAGQPSGRSLAATTGVGMRLDAQRSMNWDKARDSVPLRLATGVKYWLLRGAFSRISQQHAALDWPDGVGLSGSSEHIQPSGSRPAASVPEPGPRGRAQEGREGQQPQATFGHEYRLVIRKHRLASNSRRGTICGRPGSGEAIKACLSLKHVW